jgi:4-carboxymuconolactone decarboxylase
LHDALIPQLHRWSKSMTQYVATGDSVRIYEQVPQLARIRKDVLLGDVWKQPEMAFRDRILVTLGVLAAGGKVEEMKAWMARGLEAGITLDELRGLVVQVTFYAGWPAGLAAGRAALELFEAGQKK